MIIPSTDLLKVQLTESQYFYEITSKLLEEYPFLVFLVVPFRVFFQCLSRSESNCIWNVLQGDERYKDRPMKGGEIPACLLYRSKRRSGVTETEDRVKCLNTYHTPTHPHAHSRAHTHTHTQPDRFKSSYYFVHWGRTEGLG